MTVEPNTLIYFILFVILGYLIGSIPFGLILTKSIGLGDIRKIGSGNIGATNVLRTGNKKIALLTLFLDGIKGFIAIILVKILFSYEIIPNINNHFYFECITGVSAVIGHCFPIWLKFRGGKGVATGFGVILYLNILVGVVALLIWLLSAKLFKISSLSALFSYIIIPISMYFFSSESIYLISSIIISSVCFFQHRENIKRLIKGTEPKI